MQSFILEKDTQMAEQKFAPVDDDVFAAFASEVAAESDNGNGNSRYGRANASSFSHDYEKIAWTGLEQKKMSIIRFLGMPPFTAKPSTGIADTIEIFTSDIKDDNGKRMRLNLPLRADISEKDHLMWKIIDEITKVNWENDPKDEKKRVKFFQYERRNPELFNRVFKGGFTEKDGKQFAYAKGWAGQQVLIANVIDRKRMDWHRENKHSMLLSKDIRFGTEPREDGTYAEYISTGVPSFGFKNLIGQLVGTYGNWEKFDIGIIRTGDKQNPYKIINASMCKDKDIPELPKELLPFTTNTTPLTEEELSWDRYDLKKLFAPTPYFRIMSRLGGTIKAIDVECGTRFYETLVQLAAEEKAKWEAESKAKQTGGVSVPAGTVTTPATKTPAPARAVPTRAAAPAPVAVASFDPADLKGWNTLSLEEKAQVVGVIKDSAGVVVDVEYSADAASPVGCPTCGIPSPNSFLHCPACGRDFSITDEEAMPAF